MIEQEQETVRQAILESTMLGFGEGISTAAEMIRESANHAGFLMMLRLNPRGALKGLAAAIENTNAENSSQP